MKAVLFLGVVALGVGCAPASNLPPTPPAISTPAPSFDGIDYAHPERYLTLHASLGDRAAIERAASEARDAGSDPVAAAIVWFDAHARNEIEHPYVWRPFERVVKDGYWMSCADRAVALGTVLRAMSVPTVWVKSMDVQWIRESAAGSDSGYRGHVYLEVFIAGAWRLLDPVTERIYDVYDPRAHLLPGTTSRYAYDKGDDPYAMILSMRELEWRAQTREFFAHFPLERLFPGAWPGIPAPSNGHRAF